LLPSTLGRQTTSDRLDCEGKIYLCEALGAPDDAGDRGKGSAHWWRNELSKANRFEDREWVILQVDIGRVLGATLDKDIWSASGIIVTGVDRIPRDVIRQVYPQPC
jgi:hypothetical protein